MTTQRTGNSSAGGTPLLRPNGEVLSFGPRSDTGSVLTIATWNLWKDSHLRDERLAVAAAELAPHNPDVICLQEVVFDEHGSTAHRLAAALDMRVSVAAALNDRDGVVSGVAVLTRHRVLDTTELRFRVTDARFSTYGAAGVQLGAEAGELCGTWVFSTHLSWSGNREAVRLAEACQIDRLAEELAGDRPFVLTGDLNTEYDSSTLRWLTGRDVVDGTSTYWVDAGTLLGETTPTSVPNDQWTRYVLEKAGKYPPFETPARRIDHVLVRGWVYDQPGCPQSLTQVGDVPRETAAGAIFASDHRGLVVTLRTERERPNDVEH